MRKRSGLISILTGLLISLLLVTACGDLDLVEQSEPEPIVPERELAELPLPTEEAITIIAIIITPTPAGLTLAPEELQDIASAETGEEAEPTSSPEAEQTPTMTPEATVEETEAEPSPEAEGTPAEAGAAEEAAEAAEIPNEIIVIIMTPTPEAETPAPEAGTPEATEEAPAEEAEPSTPEAETPAPEAEAPEEAEEAPAEEAEEASAEATPPEVDKQAEAETPAPEAEAPETGEEAPATEAEVTGTPGAEATVETDKPSEAQTPTATATVAPLSQEELVNQGAELFTLNCAACYQPDGQGIEQAYPPLAGNPFIASEDPMAAIEVVLTGRGEMPNFRDDLSSEEIAAILSYTRNAWNNDTSVVQPGQVNQLRENLAEETEVTDKEH